MSDEAEADSAVAIGPGPGGLLRNAREQRGLTDREAADVLNLPARFVTAMEHDEFDKLPADIFARGYLRAYARLLELDIDEVLARYKHVMPAEPVRVEHPRRLARRGPLINIDPGLMLLGIGVLVLLFGIAGLWSLFGPAPDTPVGEAVESGQAPTTLSIDDDPLPELESLDAAPLPDTEVSSAGNLAANRLSAGDEPEDRNPLAPDSPARPAGQAAEDVADTGVLQLTPAVQPNVPQRRRGIERSARAIRVDTGTGDDRLVLSFREDSWTEISSADGRALFQDLVRAGVELNVAGAAPFRILLGYAPGASVNLNGQAVNLAPHTRDGVAILVVGQ